MHPMLNTAVKAARRAGNIIMRYSTQLDRLAVEFKGRNDFVSEVDRMAESEILKVIRTAYPDHAVIAEESGSQGKSEYQWIIDPLDGTTNYLHGYPQFAVSIALQHKGKMDQAVVYDPLRNEVFTATRGEGSMLNDRRIRVSQVSLLEFALIGTGFPFKSRKHLEVWINTFRDLITKTSGIRRAGSAALDLAHIACGRLDGFWEFGLHAWDMAAGGLLIEEAGGMVGDTAGGQEQLATGHMLAGNPRIYKELLNRLKPFLTELSAADT